MHSTQNTKQQNGSSQIISIHLTCAKNKKDTNKKAEKVKESGSELGPKMDRGLTAGGAIKYIGKTTLELPIFINIPQFEKVYQVSDHVAPVHVFMTLLFPLGTSCEHLGEFLDSLFCSKHPAESLIV